MSRRDLFSLQRWSVAARTVSLDGGERDGVALCRRRVDHTASHVSALVESEAQLGREARDDFRSLHGWSEPASTHLNAVSAWSDAFK